jgi:preprotein translocase subunit YajC
MPDPFLSVVFAIFAMGGSGAQPGWSVLLVYGVILAIFYFLVLLPMKRKQRRIQDFQASLKVGDKVVTTGGMYGRITRVTDKTVQLEIADRVRIELARGAIGGYQGQDPVVPESGNV